MTRRTFQRRMIGAALTLIAGQALPGCGDTPQAPAPAAELQLSGDTGADTIGTILAQPLIVKVRLAGVPDSAAYLVFDASPADTSLHTNVSIAGVPTGTYRSSLEVRADSTGTAQVFVRLGTHAGSTNETVKISAPDIGLEKTATYTVLPGRPASITSAPHDTMVYVGGTVQYRVALKDRGGNVLKDSATFSAGNGTGYVITPGGLATGTVISRNQIALSNGTAFDSVYLSVVPPGTVVGVSGPNVAKLVRINIDGSGRTVLVDSIGGDPNGVVPAWSPAGDSIAYASSHRLYLVGANGGAPRRLIPNPPANLTNEIWPLYSADGTTVFFTGGVLNARAGLWSVRTDGTALTSFGPSPADTVSDYLPAPSLDGGRVAYVTTVPDPILGGATVLKILTIAGGAVAPWFVRGTSPMWSKDGATIVYTSASYYKSAEDGFLHVINPDGTGDRVLSRTAISANAFPSLSWSPDGKWIGAGLYGLNIVDASTGFVIPVPLGLYSATWRPVP